MRCSLSVTGLRIGSALIVATLGMASRAETGLSSVFLCHFKPIVLLHVKEG
jgi:hypothetical protein